MINGNYTHNACVYYNELICTCPNIEKMASVNISRSKQNSAAAGSDYEQVCSLFMRLVLGEDIIPDLQTCISTTGDSSCLNTEIGFLVPGPNYTHYHESQCLCKIKFENIHGVPTDPNSLGLREEFVKCYTPLLTRGSCECCQVGGYWPGQERWSFL
jgi:hypothetical protein